MSIRFVWDKEYQTKSAHRQPHRLRSGILSVSYYPTAIPPRAEIEVMRNDPDKLDESISELIEHIKDVLESPHISVKETHADTRKITIRNIPRREIRSLIAYMCEQAWVAPSMLREMHRDFAVYDRNISDDGPSR